MLLMDFIQECEIRYGDKIILPVGRGDFEAEVMPVSRSVVSNSCRPHALQPSRLFCPGDLLDPGIEPRSPALQADSLPSEPPGKQDLGL